MKPSDNEKFLVKLKSDLDIVQQEISRLYFQRQVFQKLKRVFSENKILEAEWTPLHSFIFDGYVTQAFLHLRRLMDPSPHKKTVSLANIIARIAEHPELFTRDKYLESYVGNSKLQAVLEHRKEETNRFFNRFADPNDVVISPDMIKELYMSAKSSYEKVQAYVDKRLAHYDRKEPKKATWGELDEAVDAVGDLYLKMQLLLTGSRMSLETLAGTWQGADWEALLEIPWVERKYE